MLRALLEHDRAAVGVCLLAAIGLAWAYLWSHAGMDMQPGLPFLFLMWWIMMVAMMLPGAAPMILLFATVSGRQREHGKPYVPTAVFASTYLAVWGVFGLVAAALQWWLESRLDPVMTRGTSSAWLAGGLLLGAGLYQLTPFKDACLRQCRSPMQFVIGRWRPGLRGALLMGAEHGAYCVGCCWLLMGLLFVGGVMNLYWVIGLAVYVLLEKVLPAAPWLGRTLGIVLAAAGGWLLVSAF